MIYYEFDSINSLLNFLDNTEVNKKIFNRNLSSRSNNISFTKTKSYEEARLLLKNGDVENYGE